MNSLTDLNLRRHERTSRIASAAVVVADGRYLGTYVVENLSAGGALLVGACRLAPGDAVEVILQFGNRLSVPFAGRVARVAEQVFAVEFENVPALLRSALNQLVRVNNERSAGVVRTLIVHSEPGARLALESALTGLGQSVLAFGDADSAIRWIRTSADPVCAAVIDPILEDTSPMLALIQTRFPSARRILVFDPAKAPRSLKRMIASEMVQALLHRAWTLLSLSSALFHGGFPKRSAQRCLENTQTAH